MKVFSGDRGEWKLRGTVKHSDSVSGAWFSPDSSRLLTSSSDNTVGIYELNEGQWQKEKVFTHHSSVATSEFLAQKKSCFQISLLLC